MKIAVVVGQDGRFVEAFTDHAGPVEVEFLPVDESGDEDIADMVRIPVTMPVQEDLYPFEDEDEDEDEPEDESVADCPEIEADEEE